MKCLKAQKIKLQGSYSPLSSSSHPLMVYLLLCARNSFRETPLYHVFGGGPQGQK